MVSTRERSSGDVCPASVPTRVPLLRVLLLPALLLPGLPCCGGSPAAKEATTEEQPPAAVLLDAGPHPRSASEPRPPEVEPDATLRLAQDPVLRRAGDQPGSMDLPLLVASLQKLSPSTSGHSFGQSVALEGSTLVVGQSCASSGTADSCSGAVFVYSRSGTSWKLAERLVASDLKSLTYLGDAVSVGGNTVAAGAPRSSDAGLSSGSAYLFTGNGGTWKQQQKLAVGQKGDKFASSVSLEGDTLLAGASHHTPTGKGQGAGAVYVFQRSGTSWSQVQKLVAAGSGAGARFGQSVSMKGKVALVGAPGDSQKGAAHVYHHDGTAWQHAQKLTANDAMAGDSLGESVSVSKAVMVVGAPGADAAGVDSGAAYVFHRSGSAWKQAHKLSAKDGAAGDKLGHAVAIAGDVVVAGATGDDDKGQDSGAVYLFVRDGSAWKQLDKLVASDGAAGDGHGSAVDLDGATLVVGTPQVSTKKGKAYVYHLTYPPGVSCSDKAHCASGYCADGVCCDTACGGGAQDCQACSVKAGAAKDGVCKMFAAGVSCRPTGGDCDLAEVCDGKAVTCPLDSFVAAKTICRKAGGFCGLAEHCSGSSAACPADLYLDGDTVCRASLGGCDLTENCTGSSASCPTDRIKAKAATCRASTGPCDVAEVCDGITTTCPVDKLLMNGTACGENGTCSGGVCQNLQQREEPGCSCAAGGPAAGTVWLLLLLLALGVCLPPRGADRHRGESPDHPDASSKEES